MFSSRSILLVLLLSGALLFPACSDYQQVLKGSDYEAKWKIAQEKYEKKDYNKALPLFEELLTVFRGTSKAEQLYFYYAYAHFGIDDFQSAQYFFDNFTSTFPNSRYSEEAAYMVGYCLYKDSPRFNLDPTSTYRAIAELQGFTNRFPRSKRVEDCNKLIEELRGKLETKTFRLAQLYYNIENYQAAIIAFKNFSRDFPDTRLAAEANHFMLLSAYKYALGSVETKKRERFNEAIKYYYTFAERFADSELKKSAEDIYARCNKELETLDRKQEQNQKRLKTAQP
jgi:outer membrane protein assembly factor BamD